MSAMLLVCDYVESHEDLGVCGDDMWLVKRVACQDTHLRRSVQKCWCTEFQYLHPSGSYVFI